MYSMRLCPASGRRPDQIQFWIKINDENSSRDFIPGSARVKWGRNVQNWRRVHLNEAEVEINQSCGTDI